MSDEIKAKKVYGIDLGTTYSAIAVVDDTNNANIIPNVEGDRITASAVFFESAGESGNPNVIVGKTAKENANTDPDHFVDFVKPHMGSTDWKREIEGIEWTPEMISAEILKKLVKGVEQTGTDVEDVVITCPAYFNDAQRRATEAAGKIAGLKVLAVINEPTAAALHYGLNNATGEQTAVVYDLGGGTFDVTVVKIAQNEIEVVCSDGNHKLGGKDWDAKIAQYLAEKFAEENGVSADDLLNDPETATELRIGAEIVKQTLTLRPKATRKVTYNGVSSRIEMDLETFDALTKSLLDETEALTEKMMKLAEEKGVTKFDEFLMVGGSTRMLQVEKMVKAKFGPRIANEPRKHEVDEAVAKGAAVYGAIKETIRLIEDITGGTGGEQSNPDEIDPNIAIEVAGRLGVTPDVVKERLKTTIKNVAARSYGIRVLKSGQPIVFNLIHKQTSVPAEFSKEFPVSEDDAAKLPLKVFENENLEDVASLEESSDVGETEMDLADVHLKKGSPIRITFKLNESGVLEFEALDVTNNREVKATFTPKGALTQEEIEAARNTVGNLTVD